MRGDIALQCEASGGIHIGQLFRHHGIEAKVETRPAILLRHAGAEKPCLPYLTPLGLADNPLAFMPVEIGHHYLVENLTHRITEHLVIFVIGGPPLHVQHCFSPVKSAVRVKRRAFFQKCVDRLLVVLCHGQHHLLTVFDRQCGLKTRCVDIAVERILAQA